jgi:hypothetical protein
MIPRRENGSGSARLGIFLRKNSLQFITVDDGDQATAFTRGAISKGLGKEIEWRHGLA